MLSSSKPLSCPTVIKAADAFVTQVQSISTSVQDWAQAAISKDFFLNSVGTLTVKVEDIGQRAQEAQQVGSVESAQLRRLCEEVRAGLVAAYLTVEQNAKIQNPADERFFFDHLEQLEKGWCSHDAPLYAHYTQAHDPVAPSEIEALDSTDFLQTLGKYSDTFGDHPVSCFVSYAEADGPSFAAMLCKHLKTAGIDAKIQDDLGPRIGRQHDVVEQAVQDADYVIVLGSKAYGESTRSEQPLILEKGYTGRLLRALVGGTVLRSFPTGISHSRSGYADFRQAVNYHSQTLDLLECLHSQTNQTFPVLASPAIPKIHPIQARLRKAYAERPAFRRFMGEKVKFESAYVVPSIFASMKGSKRFWITGEPGSGKSTLCHYIAYLYGTSQEHQLGEWAANCSGIIWIPLRELLLYDKNDISLAQLVADLWFKGTIVNGLEQWLQSPDLIYLLDSEEESHHVLNERSSRGRLLNQLLDKPQSIITSRTDERRPETTRKIELPLLDNAAVKTFVDRYFTDTRTPEQTPRFLESIPHAMHELVEVPLTLELLCYRWSRSGHHSTAPIHLYQGILTDLCRLKAEKLGEDLSALTDEEVEAKFPALPYLFKIAFQAKRQGKEDLIDPALYAPILQQVEGDQRQHLYEQLFADEAFVRRVGRPAKLSNQSYVFHHAVFMDYCAARHLAPLLVASGDGLKSFIGEWDTSKKFFLRKNFPYWLQTALLARVLRLTIDPMQPPLQRAAASGNLEKVELLLDEGALVNQTAKGGVTPLHVAAQGGYVEVAKLLLDRGALVNQATKGGQTPLHVAAFGGHVEMAKLFLDRGASIDQTMKGGATPLHVAALGGHVEMATLLLDRGASIDQAEKNGATPLHMAALDGQAEVAKLLLDRGASIDQTIKEGEAAPLHAAVDRGHVEVAKLLLDRGASIDQAENDRELLLCLAVSHGHLEVAKLLLDRGASIDQAEENGEIPLHTTA